MDVKAISAINFSGGARSQKNKKHKSANEEFMTNNEGISSKASKGLRNVALGTIAATTALGTLGTLSSCEDLTDASASASASSAAVAIGGWGNHRDTVTIIKPDTIIKNDTIYKNDTVYVKPDTIVTHDTIIKTVVEPIYVKDYPYAIGDSLIEQGQNTGIPVDGPLPDGSNNVVYVGSKAHNRYDNKFYESMVDSIGTNKYELAVATKVVDTYGEKPKTYYNRAIVTDVPGKGIKIMRYVADTDKKPGKNEQYKWNYAGYEIRTNFRDGRQNVKTIFDNEGNLVYKGRFERGEESGTFLYSTYAVDPSTGDIIYDKYGDPVEIQYDFDQAVIYTDFAQPVEDYEYPGWYYGD